MPSPKPLLMMISRFSSNTEIPVPSNSTREGSFWDLNLKKTEDDMVSSCMLLSRGWCLSKILSRDQGRSTE